MEPKLYDHARACGLRCVDAAGASRNGDRGERREPATSARGARSSGTARAATSRAIPNAVAPRRPGDPARLQSGGARALEPRGSRPTRPAPAGIAAAWRFDERHPRGCAGPARAGARCT